MQRQTAALLAFSFPLKGQLIFVLYVCHLFCPRQTLCRYSHLRKMYVLWQMKVCKPSRGFSHLHVCSTPFRLVKSSVYGSSYINRPTLEWGTSERKDEHWQLEKSYKELQERSYMCHCGSKKTSNHWYILWCGAIWRLDVWYKFYHTYCIMLQKSTDTWNIKWKHLFYTWLL